ncbi:cation-dependent mannose-6-phosphate receptor-like [Amphibalanus amphitrite]|uniref:cation-dependent mannose-6-phosphate receptor-like n=1 Tax=Amphibalanus amphitrite TaxID=1232801 RepID=UPI001C90FBC8|nr:cation-dependent mannose-6-phosphate receptor-like [Amphibalanus amphitrite]XP_043244672.1 cation-dependent mannose-6-phosphate receptor-like [Amphibalanus amphitrite]
MLPSWIVVCMAAAICLLPLPADSLSCTKVPGDLCTCRMENGSLISLDAISGRRSPVFSDVKEVGSGPGDGNGFLYYFDPCRSFRLPGAGAACDGVSVCQKDSQGQYHNLGELGHTTMGWDPKDKQYYISYVGCFGVQCRTTNVSLVCQWGWVNPELKVLQQNPPGSLQYKMVLSSQCACPDGCPEEVHQHPLSAGGVFLVVLVVGMLFYLVVGVAYRRIVVGATGVEMIPNRRFWAGLPGLVRDGVTYCVTCRRADAAYDQI